MSGRAPKTSSAPDAPRAPAAALNLRIVALNWLELRHVAWAPARPLLSVLPAAVGSECCATNALTSAASCVGVTFAYCALRAAVGSVAVMAVAGSIVPETLFSDVHRGALDPLPSVAARA